MTTFSADYLPAYIRSRIDLYQQMADNPAVTSTERTIMEDVIADLKTILDTLEANA